MENASLGRVLYRQPNDVNVRMPYVMAVALAGYGTFVLLTTDNLWSILLGVILIVISPAAILGAIAFVPRRSVVFEHGVALSVNAWAVWAGHARRFVPSGEVAKVWPVLLTSPGDPDPYLDGYEVEYLGGRGRVIRGLGGPEAEARFKGAMHAMLGPRWDELHRPIPDVTPELVARIADIVSRPHRRSGGMYLAGMLLFAGVIMCAAVLGQYRWRPPLPLAVSLTLFAAGGILLVPAAALIAWDIRERKAADDALALYLQIREHERATRTRVLPWMPIHPDFYDTDPLGGRAPADTAYLERGLHQRTVGVLWAAAVVSAVIGGGSVIVASDLPSWVLVVPLLGSLVFVPPCARAIAIYRGAKTYLLGLIRDEWKAKERILPAGFPVPPRFERLRDAATLPAAYPRRIAAAFRLGWFGEFLPLVLLFGVLFVWMIPYELHVPWPFALTILVLAMAATGVFWWWLEDGRALHDSLLEYEQVTDVTPAPAEPRR